MSNANANANADAGVIAIALPVLSYRRAKKNDAKLLFLVQDLENDMKWISASDTTGIFTLNIFTLKILLPILTDVSKWAIKFLELGPKQ